MPGDYDVDTKRISVQVDVHLLQSLQQVAHEQGMSLAAFMRSIAEDKAKEISRTRPLTEEENKAADEIKKKNEADRANRRKTIKKKKPRTDV